MKVIEPSEIGSQILTCKPTLGCVGDWNTKIETRLIGERFASVMSECVILTPQVHRRYSK